LLKAARRLLIKIIQGNRQITLRHSHTFGMEIAVFYSTFPFSSFTHDAPHGNK